jgi:hypothetical protein
MNHFQPKTLAFYGGAIAFVVGLFGVVTTYGEANLKTAQSVGGDYRLNLPVSEPCGGGKPVLLSVQQSGVYVAAALTNPALARSPSISKSMTLSGQWKNQRLGLTGQIPVGVLCDGSQETAPMTVKLDGVISQNPASTESTTLTGTIFLNAAASPFMAQRQPVAKDGAK